MFDGLTNSRSDWIARVAAAHGIELLFSREWRLIAASKRVWEESGQSPDDHIGKSLWDYPFLRPGRFGLESLGFFEGKTVNLKLSIELHLSGPARTRDLDFWPIMVDDGSILVHLAGVARPAANAADTNKQAFRILDYRITPAISREPEAV